MSKNKNNNAEMVVTKTIIKNKLFKKRNYLLLMVSGGSDSVAMCYLLNDYMRNNEHIAIMHLNHKIREDADKDEKFVKNLSKYLAHNFYSYSEDVKKIAELTSENMEAVGHELRYEYANKAAVQWAKDINIKPENIVICSAHNADDRIENFYMRSIVGTGPGGFSSISYKNKNVARPLLDAPKEALQKYLLEKKNCYTDKNGNKWHEDITNSDTHHLRSYVRHNIVPLAKRQNPQVINNLCNTMNLISEENDYMEKQVKQVQDKYITIEDASFIIAPEFKDEDLVLKRRAVYNSLKAVFDKKARIETRSISSILQATEEHNYTDNIQENYSVHSNKKGVLVQPMQDYRKSRNRI